MGDGIKYERENEEHGSGRSYELCGSYTLYQHAQRIYTISTKMLKKASIITAWQLKKSHPLIAIQSLYISTLIPGSRAASYIDCQCHASRRA